MDEFEASLSLRHTRGLGPKTWKRLLEAYGSAAEAVAGSADWVTRGLTSPKIREEYLRGDWREKAAQEARRASDLGLSSLTWADDIYPDLLRSIPDPPLLLYTLGDVSLLNMPCIAVVGSRQSSHYGTQMAESIAASLSRAGVCTVSGFAFGIDRAAHAGALRGVGSTIAVLGTGIDLVYPASNRDLWGQIAARGLILSEFAPGTKPEGSNFPYRNRIVSGLSLGVLVVEGAMGSGSLITAELALAQNREVFALPGPANLKTFQGCHHLIRQGACLVQSGEDILTELEGKLRLHAQAPAEIPPITRPYLADRDQQELYDILSSQEQLHIDVLAQKTGWPAAKVSTILLLLELEGLVKQLPGMYYTPV